MGKDKLASTGQHYQQGMIQDGVVYTIQEFSRRTGFREWAIRSLRKKGLPVIRVSGRSFICGRDFLQFLDREMHRGENQSAI
jgi:hypothetical protein